MDRTSLGEGGILRQGKGREYSEGGYSCRTDEGIVLYIRRLCVSLCTRWSRLRSALSEELSR